ncbi:MAG: radical SAM protein [Acidobacteria bacterium]|nr:radical SAM protein [Acidobacteriota bacterium]
MADPFIDGTPPSSFRIDPKCFEIRRAHFPDQIVFHAPGLKRYKTSEYSGQNSAEFVSISLTGASCALSCEHCKMAVLKGMTALPQFDGSLFELCAALADRGARGVLVSGGSDKRGRVPLLNHIHDLIRVRRELGMKIRVHPGLPDAETCRALGDIDIDGAMMDVIGHQDTIREVYHLDASPEEYQAALALLERYQVPTVPHIILGLHFGRMLGEWGALEMIAAHPPKLLVLVVLMPLTGTPMALARPPRMDQIADFFQLTRKELPATPVMLGCARPLGDLKVAIDRLAIDVGFNGIAYPAEGIVEYARMQSLEPHFVNACCGVTW